MIKFDYGQLCLAFDLFYRKPSVASDVLKEQASMSFSAAKVMPARP